MAKNGFSLMWMYVMFDLPVVEPDDRKRAVEFRNFLLDEGFIMAQFSVYYKLIGGKDAIPKYTNRVQKALPPSGKVDILSITDKQYGNITTFRSRKRENGPKKAIQYWLF